MKLYRGLKSKEFIAFDNKLFEKQKSVWKDILKNRQAKDFNYSNELNDKIIELNNTNRLNYQNFTDNKDIALRYAKDNKGILVEIDLSIEEILEFFHLEFQNFGQRKVKFEIVYVVSNEILTEKSKQWKLKVIR